MVRGSRSFSSLHCPEMLWHLLFALVLANACPFRHADQSRCRYPSFRLINQASIGSNWWQKTETGEKKKKQTSPRNQYAVPAWMSEISGGPNGTEIEKKIRVGDDPIPSDRLGSYRLQSRQMISGEERRKKQLIKREVKVKQLW